MPLVRSTRCIKTCYILTPNCTEINGFYTPEWPILGQISHNQPPFWTIYHD